MACTHGQGARLDVDGVDEKLLDDTIDGADDTAQASRLSLLNDFLGPGRFGRMFDLPKFRPPDDALDELAAVMRDNAPQDPAGDADTPAGFTYFGQFVDHDITGDKSAGFPEIDDAATIVQSRSPSLDLDSLYGMGPVLQPELYDPSFPPDRARFAIGRTSAVPGPLGIGLPDAPTLLPQDLPRMPDRSAVIGDPRNDENLIVAQTHLAMLRFHNAVSNAIPGPDVPPAAGCCYSRPDGGDTLFHRAQKLVRYHYQWIVLHDFLPRIIDEAVLQDVLDNGRAFYLFEEEDGPYMPVEFSVCAYRYGHSQIRERYDWNRTFNNDGPPALTDASFQLLFGFTGGGGFPAPGPPNFTLPSNWIIDWRRFYDFGRSELVNHTRKLDTRISPKMHDLPMPSVVSQTPVSLPGRNLRRGSRIGLPTGQDVAAAMGVAALDPDQLASGPQGAVVHQFDFDAKTPLWYYVLKEAEIGGGQRLGAVGSRILAEVFVGMLQGSPYSYLSEDPGWTPTLGPTPGSFAMTDLIRFAGDINVLGPGPEGP